MNPYVPITIKLFLKGKRKKKKKRLQLNLQLLYGAEHNFLCSLISYSSWLSKLSRLTYK